MNILRNVILTSVLTLFFISTAVKAEEKIICAPVDTKSQDKIIFLPGPTAGTAQIYFLKNISKHSIWIDHPVKNAPVSAGWSSYLRPGNWSAFLLTQKDFAISCVAIRPGKVDYLDCAQEISVCAPTNLKFNPARKSSYWLVEDKPLDDLVKALQNRGVSVTK